MVLKLDPRLLMIFASNMRGNPKEQYWVRRLFLSSTIGHFLEERDVLLREA